MMQKSLLLCGLAVLGLGLGAACGSSASAVDVCSIVLTLGESSCASCWEPAEVSGTCTAAANTCKMTQACLNNVSCLSECELAGGSTVDACLVSCLKTVSPEYSALITCIGDDCSACVPKTTPAACGP
jgi:hypothetical protein